MFMQKTKLAAAQATDERPIAPPLGLSEANFLHRAKNVINVKKLNSLNMVLEAKSHV